MAQPRRGLADTALSLGVDISDRIQRLYAPPAAWSHGYLWGADTVTIPDGARFCPRVDRIRRPNRLKGSVPGGKASGYTLQIDSPTAVRALNSLVRDGADASLATAAFSGGPAGTAVFGTDRATKRALEDAAREFGLDFGKLGSGRAAEPEADRARAADRGHELVRRPADGQHAPEPARRPERLGAARARLRRRGDQHVAAQQRADQPAARPTTSSSTPAASRRRPTTRGSRSTWSPARGSRSSSRRAATTSAARPAASTFLTGAGQVTGPDADERRRQRSQRHRVLGQHRRRQQRRSPVRCPRATPRSSTRRRG